MFFLIYGIPPYSVVAGWLGSEKYKSIILTYTARVRNICRLMSTLLRCMKWNEMNSRRCALKCKVVHRLFVFFSAGDDEIELSVLTSWWSGASSWLNFISHHHHIPRDSLVTIALLSRSVCLPVCSGLHLRHRLCGRTALSQTRELWLCRTVVAAETSSFIVCRLVVHWQSRASMSGSDTWDS